jgi:ATP-dependent DNA helicase PIF1
VVATCLHKSPLWKHFRIMKLSVNMRVKASGNLKLEDFDRWTVSLGDGTAKTVGEDGLVEIPLQMCVPIKAATEQDPEAETKSMQRFAELIYPNLQRSQTDPSVFVGRAILAPTNKRVDSINYEITKMMPGKAFPLYSSDVLDNPSDMFRYNIEYMNTLNPSGLPRHQLLMKTGIPLMLLRNLNPINGLCNGTRLIFKSVNNNLLTCTISGGQFDGKTVLIPRISFQPKVGMYAFEWSRRQFPVRTSFAMTINKVKCAYSLRLIFISVRRKVRA